MLTSGIYSSDNPSTLISGVTYTYNNPLAQLKDITCTDGQKYSFTYDIWGRVTDNLSGVSTEYHYDLLGRLVSSTLSQGGIDIKKVMKKNGGTFFS